MRIEIDIQKVRGISIAIHFIMVFVCDALFAWTRNRRTHTLSRTRWKRGNFEIKPFYSIPSWNGMACWDLLMELYDLNPIIKYVYLTLAWRKERERSSQILWQTINFHLLKSLRWMNMLEIYALKTHIWRMTSWIVDNIVQPTSHHFIQTTFKITSISDIFSTLH